MFNLFFSQELSGLVQGDKYETSKCLDKTMKILICEKRTLSDRKHRGDMLSILNERTRVSFKMEQLMIAHRV